MSTLLERLCQAVRGLATAYNRDDEVAPAAILWTDGKRQWEPLLPRLREELPELCTLGPYDPAARSGPAIFLVTVVAGALPEVLARDSGRVPVLYLPGVDIVELRSDLEHCPPLLQPLAELRFRGKAFLQEGGRDWTVNAFLVNQTVGLGLEVARDEATQAALLAALPALAKASVETLRGRRLQAADFQVLLLGDAEHRLLAWLHDPAVRQSWDAPQWRLFVDRCRQHYGFDPESGDALLEAARRLAAAQGPWGQLWERFARSPHVYRGIVKHLRQARPAQQSLTPDPHWPQDNEDAERALRRALEAASNLAPAQARARLLELEAEHGPRRAWVWAALGQAPLAVALEHVAEAARGIDAGIAGADAAALMAAYRESGWRVDAAVIQALASVTSDADLALVSRVLAACYLDWLERLNSRFTERMLAEPIRPEPVPAQPGRCILFVDGLRYDIGKLLAQALRDDGLAVDEGWSFAALPTVTATAKPAVAPFAAEPGLLSGEAPAVDFMPIVAATHRPLDHDGFRRLLAERGIQVLGQQETGDPSGCAWSEHGRLDARGHDEQLRLCHRIREEIGSLCERIGTLLAAGWREVVVATDHGWLLVPGGLPRHELPVCLVETRWARAAVVKIESDLRAWSGTIVRWTWNPAVAIAVAPGCSAFRAGSAYAHGGLSLQECVLPRLAVRLAAPAAVPVRIGPCAWRGLRCVVRIQGAPAGSSASIRTKAGDPNTRLSGEEVAITAPDGEVRLLVHDHDREGASASVVVCGPDGRVLAKRPITIGEEEHA